MTAHIMSPTLRALRRANVFARGRTHYHGPGLDANARFSLNSPEVQMSYPQKSSSFENASRKSLIPRNPDTVVKVEVEGKECHYSPVLLRDLCTCSQCVDPSTKQKNFSTADIPANIRAEVSPSENPLFVSLQWKNDIPSYENHTTEIPETLLKLLNRFGTTRPAPNYSKKILWNADQFQEKTDIDYQAYMTDDTVLLEALQQLHTYGLLFLSNVPESEESVSTVAERIGPLKNTFYGKTWDVRSVPEAKNVAYTAQNLGFHMDLMYMEQPPHLQLLHCIRSSSAGGASLFTDSFRAVACLAEQDPVAARTLGTARVDFHYDHPGSHYYHQTRHVIEQKPIYFQGSEIENLGQLKMLQRRSPWNKRLANLGFHDFPTAVSWAPPFQAPFSERYRFQADPQSSRVPTQLSNRVEAWHKAARKFSALIEQPEGIFERLMKPGECVIFDNRRVLHARKAFDVDDAGKERWLRGAYVDKDPYLSKLRVLTEQYA